MFAAVYCETSVGKHGLPAILCIPNISVHLDPGNRLSLMLFMISVTVDAVDAVFGSM
eukprot:m.13835 g.13835  ORF g.13835 m.13835 type:complete len:57 (-) comp10227_c0_seq2:39-209(-)